MLALFDEAEEAGTLENPGDELEETKKIVYTAIEAA